jgi:hypothetical protein
MCQYRPEARRELIGHREKEPAVRYMLMIFNNPAAIATFGVDELERVMAEVEAIMGELQASGEWLGGEALADVSQSKTVRVRDGMPAVTDGPYVEAKEHLAGYCLLDCESEQRALEIAARWPDARYTAVELRPLMETSGAEM